MRYYCIIILVLCILHLHKLLPHGVASDASPTHDPEMIQSLESIRKQFSLPALAGAIVTSDGLLRQAVVGVRKHGTTASCQLNDRWHLGSDTKAMTSALAARLVEKDLLHWDSTVSEVFPEFVQSFHQEYKQVTLRHLLTHQAGLKANLVWRKYDNHKIPIQDQRLQVVKEALSSAPEYPPGSKFLYSNLGYVIAGSMIEKVTKRTWEQAILEEVFIPLNMHNTGQGGQGTPGNLDQPWGHTRSGTPVKINGPEMDNPPVLGPAGRVHSTMADWSLFVADFLSGLQGKGKILKLESYKTIVTPPQEQDYALGWKVLQRDWGGGTVYHHAGCNTMNYANVWIAPKKNFAVLVCCNQGDDNAAKATDQAASALINIFLSKQH